MPPPSPGSDPARPRVCLTPLAVPVRPTANGFTSISSPKASFPRSPLCHLCLKPLRNKHIEAFYSFFGGWGENKKQGGGTVPVPNRNRPSDRRMPLAWLLFEHSASFLRKGGLAAPVCLIRPLIHRLFICYFPNIRGLIFHQTLGGFLVTRRSPQFVVPRFCPLPTNTRSLIPQKNP